MQFDDITITITVNVVAVKCGTNQNVVRPSFRVSINVCQCISVYISVYKCTSVYISVYKCISVHDKMMHPSFRVLQIFVRNYGWTAGV